MNDNDAKRTRAENERHGEHEREERERGYRPPTTGAATPGGVHAPIEGEAERGEGGDTRSPVSGHARGVAKDDQVVTPAHSEEARLGALHGRGVLTITLSAEGELIDSQGSWFPESPEVDLSELEAAAQAGETLLFEGTQVEAETAGHDDGHGVRVRRRVKLTGVRSYRDREGKATTLVSFELPEDEHASDVPEQYTHEEFMKLSLDQVVDISGLTPPAVMGEAEERDFRQKAWQSYELDIEHRDEWGTARQDIPLPRGE